MRVTPMTTAFPPRGSAAAPTAVPAWMIAGGTALMMFCGLAFWPWASTRIQESVLGACIVVRLALESWTYMWASGREGLPAQMRQTLRAFAVISAISVGSSTLETFGAVGAVQLLQHVSDGWMIASYLLWVIAVLWYPRRRMRGAGALLTSDVLITLAGYGTLMLLLVTLPSLESVGASNQWKIIPGAAAQTLLLIGLNVLVMRGIAFPSRRAFWCLVAAWSAYLPTQVLSQLEYAEVLSFGWSPTAYYLSVILSMAAAYFIRVDPVAVTASEESRPWYGDLNPIPLSAAAALSVVLMLTMTRGPAHLVRPLIAALVVTVTLLLFRSIIAGRNTVRLEAQRVADERRLGREKREAVARLAGGVAHECNNAMTVVLGSAEIGVGSVNDSRAVLDSFALIRDAGTRMTRTAVRLQLAAERQVTHRTPVDVGHAVRRLLIERNIHQAQQVKLETDGLDTVGTIPVDAAQLSLAVEELLANAIAATARGGRVRLEASRCRLDAALATAISVVPAGEYVGLRVQDFGSGIPPSLVPSVFESFTSTRSFDPGAGLGLSVVRSVVLAHGGGIIVESTAGKGTAMTLLLPATAPRAS